MIQLISQNHPNNNNIIINNNNNKLFFSICSLHFHMFQCWMIFGCLDVLLISRIIPHRFLRRQTCFKHRGDSRGVCGRRGNLDQRPSGGNPIKSHQVWSNYCDLSRRERSPQKVVNSKGNPLEIFIIPFGQIKSLVD